MKYLIADFQKTVLTNWSLKRNVKLCELHSHMTLQFLRKLFFSYYVRIFLFHQSPQWAPKYTFAESATTVFANCSKKGSVELCVMKSHFRKQSLRMLLCRYYVRIFPLSPWAPIGSQISLCRFHEKNVSKLFREGKGGTPYDEVTHQKRMSQNNSLYLIYEDISFFTMGPHGLLNITLKIPRKEC